MNSYFSSKNYSKTNYRSKAVIYKSELDYISKCILDYPNNETGGDFFGFWTHSGIPVIHFVIGPGPKANHQGSFFNQDEEYLLKIGEILQKRHGLQHIGSWHSHHQMGLVTPSGHDASTMIKAINNNNLNKFLMILGSIPSRGTTTIKGFLFQKNKSNYLETGWIVLEGTSPTRIDVDNFISKSDLYIPKTIKANYTDLKISSLSENIYINQEFEPKSWMSTKQGQSELKIILNKFKAQFQNVKMSLTDNKSLKLSFSYDENIFNVLFLSDFPQTYPIITIKSNDEFVPINKDDIEKEFFVYSDANQIIDYISKYVYNYRVPVPEKELRITKENLVELKQNITTTINNDFKILLNKFFSESIKKDEFDFLKTKIDIIKQKIEESKKYNDEKFNKSIEEISNLNSKIVQKINQEFKKKYNREFLQNFLREIEERYIHHFDTFIQKMDNKKKGSYWKFRKKKNKKD